MSNEVKEYLENLDKKSEQEFYLEYKNALNSREYYLEELTNVKSIIIKYQSKAQILQNELDRINALIAEYEGFERSK